MDQDPRENTNDPGAAKKPSKRPDPAKDAPREPAKGKDPSKDSAKSKNTPEYSKPEPVSMAKSAKETVESILIAFVLAFVFRAFIVEAFVIPTGSMATTLLGAHMRFTCPECGYHFDVGYQSPKGPENIDDFSDPITRPVRCPNCRYTLPTGLDRPPVFYGDRILVLKYLYIPWISSPQRWDVVVFKTPTDQKGPRYSDNYIKRLTGLPNETLMILDGDLYAKRNQPDASGNEWEIKTKTPIAQDAMWRIVYDNDYRPQEHDRGDTWQFPWLLTHGDGWNTGNQSKARQFQFNNRAGRGVLTFNPTNDPRLFSDRLTYNATMAISHEYTVSDVKLTFFYQRTSGEGPLVASVTKYDDQFFAEFYPDHVQLVHQRPDGVKRILGSEPLKPAARPVRVDLQNVDYQVTLKIDGKVALQTTPDQYAPDLRRLREQYDRSDQWRDLRTPPPRIAIEAARQECSLSHISVWRDVYYTPPAASIRPMQAQGSPEHPVTLGPDEYWVLGDNSAASSDARFWEEPVDLPWEDLHVAPGRVPGRFMLGKAFFVYWPAGFRPLTNAPAVVPNFGDMRLIH